MWWYIDAVNSLAGGDEQHVPVGVVLDDDQAVAGDGDEGLELGVGGAVLDHHGPGESAPETGVWREPRPHTQLLLGGEQSWNTGNIIVMDLDRENGNNITVDVTRISKLCRLLCWFEFIKMKLINKFV